jgi:hypothetical protein
MTSEPSFETPLSVEEIKENLKNIDSFPGLMDGL